MKAFTVLPPNVFQYRLAELNFLSRHILHFIADSLVRLAKEAKDGLYHHLYPDFCSFCSQQGDGGGTVVYTLQATDRDEGNNKKLTYAISSGNNGEFILNSNTGVLQISPTGLDRELHSNYNLTINVTDAGDPMLWVRANSRSKSF